MITKAYLVSKDWCPKRAHHILDMLYKRGVVNLRQERIYFQRKGKESSMLSFIWEVSPTTVIITAERMLRSPNKRVNKNLWREIMEVANDFGAET